VSTQPLPRRLVGISPKAYEHPADRAATAALQSIPMLDKAVRKLIEFQYERAYRQVYLASAVKLGPRQLPGIWERYEDVLASLDLPDVYDLYLTQLPLTNAAAIGSGKPMILLSSGAVSLLEPDEVATVLAHEVGHILSDHVLYRTALLILLQLALGSRIPVVAGLPLNAVRSALLEWSRAAELTCDRAATLASHDPLLTCRTLLVMAGGVPSRHLDLDAFLQQADEYKEWKSGWDRLSRFMIELNLTHDFPVRRVGELTAWVRSGEYDRIVGGDYVKRDQPTDARGEAGDAVRHYTERFRKIFQEAGESVTSAGERFSDWLNGRSN
jgi:Zn-dependent protease with chaperone function